MEKKFKKVSLPLSALMATLITGTAWAGGATIGSDASGGIVYGDAHKITNDNTEENKTTFNFKAGTLTDDQFIGLVPKGSNETKDVIINIEKKGTLKINSLNGDNVINIYNHQGSWSKYNITLNGDLKIYTSNSQEYERRVINLVNGENSLTVDGDLKIKEFNQSSTETSVDYSGIKLDQGNIYVTKDFSIDSMQITADNAENANVYGIYHQGGSKNSSINLGTESPDKNNEITIKNINVVAKKLLLKEITL